jgi:prepilin-type N-terminal cleavage/methylation domain-containing protein
MKANRRSGFTIVELLVVITIMLLLIGAAMAVFNSGKSSERVRSSVRIGQSAFLGAKDRALHAKDYRGVRLTRDATNPNLINGFVYLQPMPMQVAGNSANGQESNVMTVINPLPNPSIQIVVGSPESAAWLAQDSSSISLWQPGLVKAQIPALTGQWYPLQQVSNVPPYYCQKDNAGNVILTLAAAFDNGGNQISPAKSFVNKLATDTDSSIGILVGNEVLAFHQPIPMPSGCVIDIAYSNQAVKTLASYSVPPPVSPVNVDLMFSPRGNITGVPSALGVLMFAVRTIQDATSGVDPAAPNASGDTLILSVTPATGLVQTYEADLTDAFVNSTGAAGSDGLADDLFRLAKAGQSAGR